MTSEEIWIERVLSWRASGQSAAEFCADKAYETSSLNAWSSRLGSRGRVPRAAVGRRPTKFARVVSEQPTPWLAPPCVHEPAATTPLSITVGHSRIEVRTGFDPSLLRAVVDALAGSRS